MSSKLAMRLDAGRSQSKRWARRRAFSAESSDDRILLNVLCGSFTTLHFYVKKIMEGTPSPVKQHFTYTERGVGTHSFGIALSQGQLHHVSPVWGLGGLTQTGPLALASTPARGAL
jgi:hypothetical protein